MYKDVSFDYLKPKKTTDLTLGTQELNALYEESVQVFTKWLYNITKEEDMTEKDKEIVKYFQVFLEQQISEKTIYYYMDHFRFYKIDDFIDKGITLTSRIINVEESLIKVKALCMKKLEQKQTNEKVHTRK